MIYNAFRGHAERHPEKVAINFRGQQISYGQLVEDVDKIACFLLRHGFHKGSVLLLGLHNSPLFTQLLLAASKLNIVLLPVSPEQGDSAWDPLTSKYSFSGIFVEDALAAHPALQEQTPLYLGRTEILSQLETMSHESRIPVRNNSPVDPDAPFIITVTSGSTGQPKPITLSQRCKYQRIYHGAVDVYGLTSEDVVLVASPMFHSLGMRLALLPLLIGGTSVILHRYSAKQWLTHVERHRVTFTIPVSEHLRRILPLSAHYDLTSLKVLVSSSSPLHLEEKISLCHMLPGCMLHECYGASEIGIATDICINQHIESAGSVGKPLPHAQLKIINEQGMAQETGEAGEIVCKTTTAFTHYDGLPDETNRAFTDDGFFKTGDLGWMDAYGFLWLKGRKKELIKVSGVSVYPEDIERVVLSYPGVRDAMCTSIEDVVTGEKPVLALVVDDQANFDLGALQTHVVRMLASYQLPEKWLLMQSVPRTELGKPRRSMLKQMIAENLI